MQISAARLWRYNQERRKYLGKKGVLLGWSVVRVGPQGLEKRTPYVVGLIKLDKQRVITQLADVKTDDLRIGMKLEGRLRRLFDVPDDQLIVYGVKFTPERQ